jgi:hypothetical protein
VDAVERLEAIEAIKRLKARYFRCMDTKDWAGFAGVFAPDAVMDMAAEVGSDDGIVHGNEAIAAFVREAVDPVETVHHGHMPEIDITSPTTATGIWAMEDKLRWPAGGPLATMHGYGHYHETYVVHEGEWRIATLTLVRLRQDFTFPE